MKLYVSSTKKALSRFKQGYFAVNCKTEYQQLKFLEYIENKTKLIWLTGINPTGNTEADYTRHKDKTCFMIVKGYSDCRLMYQTINCIEHNLDKLSVKLCIPSPSIISYKQFFNNPIKYIY